MPRYEFQMYARKPDVDLSALGKRRAEISLEMGISEDAELVALLEDGWEAAQAEIDDLVEWFQQYQGKELHATLEEVREVLREFEDAAGRADNIQRRLFQINLELNAEMEAVRKVLAAFEGARLHMDRTLTELGIFREDLKKNVAGLGATIQSFAR